jgi:hypothetical protein
MPYTGSRSGNGTFGMVLSAWACSSGLPRRKRKAAKEYANEKILAVHQAVVARTGQQNQDVTCRNIEFLALSPPRRRVRGRGRALLDRRVVMRSRDPLRRIAPMICREQCFEHGGLVLRAWSGRPTCT